MNIAVITREYPPYILGGLSYHLLNLYNHVSEMGHDVTIITGKCPQAKNILADQVHDDIDVYDVEFGYKGGYHILFPIALKHKIRYIDMSVFDVVLTHTQIPFSLDAPTICKFHDCFRETRQIHRQTMNNLMKAGDTAVDPFRRWVDRQAIRHSDYGIFISDMVREDWSTNYEIDFGSDIIYNGVDRDTFYPRGQDSNYILFVGNSLRKGIDRVIELAGKTEYEIRVVGDTAHSSINNLKFLDHMAPDELAKLYSGAKVTVHPARYEPFGNTILESLSCGTPVITSPNCGASELLTPKTGITSTNIYKSIQETDRLSEKDCVELSKKYTWEDVSERTLKTIQEMRINNI